MGWVVIATPGPLCPREKIEIQLGLNKLLALFFTCRMALSTTSLLELPAASVHLIPLALKRLICVWSPCELGNRLW